LIHSSLLSNGWCDIANALVDAKVTLKCDPFSYHALPKAIQETVQTSTEKDYSTEFLDLTLAVKTVESLFDAIDHINHHGSHHTDVILTESKAAAEIFMARVDSAGVYWNASSRFADGFRYGFGAEIGVSTNKTHARGPVGLEGLVIYKYKLIGHDHCVAMYGEGKRSFTHKAL
jgi:glutamate-5-semialdehyde dehydrogenase